MAPRSSWKGFLKLSLVSVPVKAFTAQNSGEDIRLNQLHDECHQRVKYQKVCPEHGTLTTEQIVSGYQYAKDQYVIIDTDEVAKLRPESDRSIRIDGFIGEDEIDPLYFAGKTYFLAPDGVAGNKPYALLHKGMVDAGVCAVAQIVLSGREQLVMVRAVENLLAMTVLSYAKKVKGIDQFAGMIEDQKLTKDELALTETLINASTIGDFDFESYKDVYIDRLTKLIEMKIDGQEVVAAPHPEEPKIINLMDALKKSVAEAQSAGAKKAAPSAGGKKKVAKKMAPSAGKKRASRAKRSG